MPFAYLLRSAAITLAGSRSDREIHNVIRGNLCAGVGMPKEIVQPDEFVLGGATISPPGFADQA
jgi:hypothetical protein